MSPKSKNTAKKPPKLKLRTRGKDAQTEKPALKPVTGWTTKAQIEELLAKANGAPAPEVTHLSREGIHVAEESTFQWRCYERDRIRSARHIDTLKKALLTQGKPLKPILVFWAGDRFFAVDGHHRLAAYDYARWDEPIPVEVFEGSLEDAQMAALQGNIEDKLPMTQAEKFDAAWRLVKEEGGHSKSEIMTLTAASLGTVNNMRSKWAAIKAEVEANGNERLLQISWAWARSWQPGDVQEHHDPDWRQKKVQRLVERLVKSGIATEMGKHLDLVMEALEQIDPNLPAAMASVAGVEVAEWVLEQHREAMAMEAEMETKRRRYLAEHPDVMHDF
jgi:ParB-like chromosome segregation protein Spo0J